MEPCQEKNHSSAGHVEGSLPGIDTLVSALGKHPRQEEPQSLKRFNIKPPILPLPENCFPYLHRDQQRRRSNSVPEEVIIPHSSSFYSDPVASQRKVADGSTQGYHPIWNTNPQMVDDTREKDRHFKQAVESPCAPREIEVRMEHTGFAGEHLIQREDAHVQKPWYTCAQKRSGTCSPPIIKSTPIMDPSNAWAFLSSKISPDKLVEHNMEAQSSHPLQGMTTAGLSSSREFSKVGPYEMQLNSTTSQQPRHPKIPLSKPYSAINRGLRSMTTPGNNDYCYTGEKVMWSSSDLPITQVTQRLARSPRVSLPSQQPQQNYAYRPSSGMRYQQQQHPNTKKFVEGPTHINSRISYPIQINPSDKGSPAKVSLGSRANEDSARVMFDAQPNEISRDTQPQFRGGSLHLTSGRPTSPPVSAGLWQATVKSPDDCASSVDTQLPLVTEDRKTSELRTPQYTCKK